jgi:hypothetical protein
LPKSLRRRARNIVSRRRLVAPNDVRLAWHGPGTLSRSAIPPAPIAAHASGAYINSSVSALSFCSALAVEEQPSQHGAERTAQNHPDRNYLEKNPHFVIPDAAFGPARTPHIVSGPSPSAFLLAFPGTRGDRWMDRNECSGARRQKADDKCHRKDPEKHFSLRRCSSVAVARGRNVSGPGRQCGACVTDFDCCLTNTLRQTSKCLKIALRRASLRAVDVDFSQRGDSEVLFIIAATSLRELPNQTTLESSSVLRIQSFANQGAAR